MESGLSLPSCWKKISEDKAWWNLTADNRVDLSKPQEGLTLKVSSSYLRDPQVSLPNPLNLGLFQGSYWEQWKKLSKMYILFFFSSMENLLKSDQHLYSSGGTLGWILNTSEKQAQKYRVQHAHDHLGLTLVSLGLSWDVLRLSDSSPRRMEEDLSELRDNASISASWTCRKGKKLSLNVWSPYFKHSHHLWWISKSL